MTVRRVQKAAVHPPHNPSHIDAEPPDGFDKGKIENLEQDAETNT